MAPENQRSEPRLRPPPLPLAVMPLEYRTASLERRRPRRIVVGGILGIAFGILGMIANPISAIGIFSLPRYVPAIPPPPQPPPPPLPVVVPHTGEVLGVTGISLADRQLAAQYIAGKTPTFDWWHQKYLNEVLAERGGEVLAIPAGEINDKTLNSAVKKVQFTNGQFALPGDPWAGTPNRFDNPTLIIRTTTGELRINHFGGIFRPANRQPAWSIQYDGIYVDDAGNRRAASAEIEKHIHPQNGAVLLKPTPIEEGAFLAYVRTLRYPLGSHPVYSLAGSYAAPGTQTVAFGINQQYSFYVNPEGRTALSSDSSIDIGTLLPKSPPGIPAIPGLHHGTVVALTIESVLSTILSGVLILVGVLLLKNQPAAHKFAVAYGIPAIIISLAGFVIGQYAGPEILAAMRIPIPMQAASGGAMLLENLLGLAFSLSLPIVILWVARSEKGGGI